MIRNATLKPDNKLETINQPLLLITIEQPNKTSVTMGITINIKRERPVNQPASIIIMIRPPAEGIITCVSF
jgi:hypothetical protein